MSWPSTPWALFIWINFNEYRHMEFGQEIRRRRLALGMTLEQLAESSHLTPNYIGTIENGRRDPSLSTVLALAKGLRTSVAELFGGIQELSPPATEAGLLFDGSNSDVQDAVLLLLRSVARRKKVLKAAETAAPQAAVANPG